MKYLKVFTDFAVAMEPLSDAETGRLFRAMLQYAELGTVPDLKGNERFVWGTAKMSIDAQRKSYDVKCENIAAAREKNPNNNQTDFSSLLNKKRLISVEDKDQDQDQDQGKKKKSIGRFAPPSREEAEAYCAEKGYTVDLNAWFAHYESNGWKVGRNPMKDWRAAIRTWVHNRVSNGQQPGALRTCGGKWMTKRDTVGVMAMLETAYPAYYAKRSDQQRMEAAALWAELFADDDPKLVYAAVKAIIVSSGAFPPSIGDIKNKMHDLSTPAGLSETEAWALVSKAIRNGIYGFQAEYDKLPPTVQAAVGRAEQLREWAVMPEDEVQSVVASNFMRGYKTVQKRERETAMIPESVKSLLADVGRAALPEATT